jgi:hypothetical protein
MAAAAVRLMGMVGRGRPRRDDIYTGARGRPTAKYGYYPGGDVGAAILSID